MERNLDRESQDRLKSNYKSKNGRTTKVKIIENYKGYGQVICVPCVNKNGRVEPIIPHELSVVRSNN